METYPRTNIPRLSALALAWLLGACGPAPASEGLRSGSNATATASQDASWRISPEPELVIGAVEGAPEYLLSGELHALRLKDRTIVVATHHTAELRFFDQQGRYLRTAGRMGTGPGEFRDIGGELVRGRGDTLIAGLSLEAVRFSPQGEFVRQDRVDRVGLARRFLPKDHRFEGMYAMPDGSLLAGVACNVMECIKPERHVYRLARTFIRITRDGLQSDSIATVLGWELLDPEYSRQHPGIFPIRPFSPKQRVAFGGDPLVIYVGESGSTEIASLRVDNGERSRFNIDISRSAVTSADIESWIVGLTNPKRPREALERSLLVLGTPKTLPLYDHLTVDVDGNLWIQHFLSVTEDQTRWSVYERTGRRLTEVEIPARVRALDIGRDYLLASWEDENDVPFVRMYRLQRPQ